MKRNTPKEIIEIAQAYMNGEEIEYYNIALAEWCDDGPGPYWDFSGRTYRIKPKEYWVNLYFKSSGTTKDVCGYAYETRDEADRLRGKDRTACVKIVENNHAYIS